MNAKPFAILPFFLACGEVDSQTSLDGKNVDSPDQVIEQLAREAGDTPDFGAAQWQGRLTRMSKSEVENVPEEVQASSVDLAARCYEFTLDDCWWNDNEHYTINQGGETIGYVLEMQWDDGPPNKDPGHIWWFVDAEGALVSSINTNNVMGQVMDEIAVEAGSSPDFLSREKWEGRVVSFAGDARPIADTVLADFRETYEVEVDGIDATFMALYRNEVAGFVFLIETDERKVWTYTNVHGDFAYLWD